MLELYHSGLTTCSKQVRLALREKGLDYTSRYVELWTYENIGADYLALNPDGVVPTLVHDGAAVTNSQAINEYLDDVFPDPPLRPADPVQRAKMRAWTSRADEVHQFVITATYSHVLAKSFAELGPETVETILAHTPVPSRRERWRRLADGGHGADELARARDMMAFAAERMDHDLGEGGPWLAGSDYSLADITMLAIIHRIGELAPELVAAERVPRLAQWRERIMARPAAAWVYSPGTEETPPRPAHKSIAGIR